MCPSLARGLRAASFERHQRHPQRTARHLEGEGPPQMRPLAQVAAVEIEPFDVSILPIGNL